MNPQRQNCRSGGPAVKLYTDFMHRGSAPLNPVLFKGQLYNETTYII